MDAKVPDADLQSGRQGARHEIRHEEQRRRILDAAIVCFSRGGFHATGMQALCAEAGMSPGALYRYFPSKDAIIEAIVERDRADIPAQLGPLLEAEEVIPAVIEAARQFLVGNLRPDSLPLYPELVSEAVRNPAVHEIMNRCDDEVGSIIQQVIERGQKLGQIHPGLDPRQTVRLLMALTDGVLMRLLLEPEAELDGLMPMYERTVSLFLAPPAHAVAESAA